MGNVELVPVTEANRAVVADLSVAEDQRDFLATPDLGSFLAEAHLHPRFQQYAIVVDGVVSGLISLGTVDGSTADWWVSLLVIDQRFQGRGVGRVAMEKALALVASQSGPEATVGLGFHPENVAARKLYSRLGFRFASGLNSNGEVVATLRVNARPQSENQNPQSKIR